MQIGKLPTLATLTVRLKVWGASGGVATILCRPEMIPAERLMASSGVLIVVSRRHLTMGRGVLTMRLLGMRRLLRMTLIIMIRCSRWGRETVRTKSLRVVLMQCMTRISQQASSSSFTPTGPNSRRLSVICTLLLSPAPSIAIG